MSKYGAKKVIVTADGTLFEVETIKRFGIEVEGEKFDSVMEGSYYQELLWMQKDGAITEIKCHPSYVLQDKPKITYIADFLISFADGQQIIVDVKGKETSTFSVKRRLFKARFPDLQLLVITKYRGQWVPIEDVKKEKVDRKRAMNKLIKQSQGKGRILHERQPKR
ncbi:phage-like protein [Cohnella kolymensis]|uniref:Phage-like protein n=1 Tax=Cohnella kolymensis TaxID=1590652 RepID=A0ABR5A3L5_9BACL|nr:DUF1064 domain-containing protein [Cohnella kolymensis]KIL35140.1 phage-like protein [Cohnella kolymensis]